MDNREIYPFRASDPFFIQGNWAQILFWKQFEKSKGIPQEWVQGKIASAPVAATIENICYVGTNLKTGMSVFAASLFFQYSAN